ncbi:MAG: extracellular solute-binding protein [Natronomonas sp.]
MQRRRSRRSFLTTATGAGVLGVTGCLEGGESVSVLSAGSLAVVLEEAVGRRFEAETGIAVHGEYYGANAVMRMVEDGQKHPDVVVSADDVLLRDRLYDDHTDWDVEFASNSVGLAYAPDTRVDRRLEAGDPWYEVLDSLEEGALAISDPDLDPLGYRAIHAFRLAEMEHDLDSFAERTVGSAYHEPEEPQLLAGVEAGNRAVAVSYHNMAVDHGLPFYEFPDAYNFSKPGYAESYGRVSYTTADGYTATGMPIVYNATVLADAEEPESGVEFVRFLSENPNILRENGLRVEGFPRKHGDIPEGVSTA